MNCSHQNGHTWNKYHCGYINQWYIYIPRYPHYYPINIQSIYAISRVYCQTTPNSHRFWLLPAAWLSARALRGSKAGASPWAMKGSQAVKWSDFSWFQHLSTRRIPLIRLLYPIIIPYYPILSHIIPYQENNYGFYQQHLGLGLSVMIERNTKNDRCKSH